MSEPTERMLTRAEVAEELGQELGMRPSRVRWIVTTMRAGLVTVSGRRGGRGVQLYGPEAVQAIRRKLVRDRARRERVKKDEGAAYWRALAGLRASGRRLEKLVHDLRGDYDALRLHPPSVSASVHTLADPGYELVSPPVVVLLRPLRQSAWRAIWPEAGLEAKGKGQKGAVLALREEIPRAYLALRANPEQNPEQWAVLEQLIRELPAGEPRSRDASQEGLHEA